MRQSLFTPIEINAEDPYRWYTPPAAHPISRLRSLDDRMMTGQYQLLVLAEMPPGGARAVPQKGGPDA